MGATRPSMVKSCIVFIERMASDRIREEKRECILTALREQLPEKPLRVEKLADFNGDVYSMRGICPRCGTSVKTPMTICYNCDRRIDWEV